jgi:hypothetical protein
MRKTSLLTLLATRSSPRNFFGDLNHDILGPLGDGKVIILDDSDEEKEAL